MNKLKQKLKVGLASLLLLGATVAVQAQTYWSDRGSDWGQPASGAFDGLKSVGWSQPVASPPGAGTITAMYPTPVKFNKVEITNSEDGYGDGGQPANQTPRAFKDWVLKASNDTLAGWTTLDTRTNEVFLKPATGPARATNTYTWANEMTYTYYRFEFVNNGNSYVQMGELAFSYVAPEMDMFWSDRASDWGEPASGAFDGFKSSGWSQPTTNNAGVITAKYAMPKKFNKVEITNQTDGYGDDGLPANQTPRAFKNWVLKASNDTVAGWTTLDTRTNEVFLKPATGPARATNTYTWANEMNYKYYRFEFVNNGNLYVQMGELAFSYAAPVEMDMFWSDRGSDWGQPASQAFDGFKSTGYSQPVTNQAGVITARYAVPKKFNKVDITNFEDGYGDEGLPANQTPRAFKDWVLKASNDTLMGWTTLDTRTNEVFLKPATGPARATNPYTFTNEATYKYYRFEFVNNGNSYVQMGELAFSYVAPPEVDMFWSDRGSDWGQPASQAFDGFKSTGYSQPVTNQAGVITARYAMPKKFNKVDITNFEDGYGDGGQPANQTPRAFKDWVLKASNDTLAGWTTLDTRSNEVFLKPATGPARATNPYSFTNEMEYKYYRFEFVNNGNSYVQMGELAFSYVAPPEVDMFWSDRGSDWGQPASQAFDGFKSTGYSQPVTNQAGVITARYAVPKKFNKVDITNFEDGYGDGGQPANQTPRAFKDWVLKASNDTLAGWTTLDTRSNEVFLKPATGPARATNPYTFTNEMEYKYYRFEFVNNGNSYVQMGELAFSYVQVTPLNSLVLSGTESNGGARLVWNTTGEINVKSFEVSKKNANGTFVIINSVNSKGDGDNTYSFFDANAAVGDNYYQVKNIDKDGATSPSNVINVKVSSLESAASIYPNPANNGLVNVVASGAVESVSIYNVSTGIKHISKRFNGSTKNVQIDIQSLSKGVYIVEVSSSLSVTRKKLIVN